MGEATTSTSTSTSTPTSTSTFTFSCPTIQFDILGQILAGAGSIALLYICRIFT